MGDDDRDGSGAVCGWSSLPWSGGPDEPHGQVPFWLGMGMFFYTKHLTRTSATGGESGGVLVFVRLRGRSQTNRMDLVCRIGIRSCRILVSSFLSCKPNAVEPVSTVYFHTG